MIFRKIVIVSITCFILQTVIKCQTAFDQGNADYIVSQPAAIQSIMENSPSLLNPSTVRTFVISAGAAGTKERGITAAGTEIAPFFLFKTFDLSKYLSGRIIRVLLRTRVSFAAQVNPQNGFRGAFGFRWMAHDDADLRSDSLFQQELSRIASNIPELKSICDDDICLAEAISRMESEQHTIDSLREVLKNRFWTGSVFEFAFTAIYNSDENNPYSNKIQQYNIYLNAGLPIKTAGLNTIGITGHLGRDNKLFQYQKAVSIINQLALGTPSYRYFGEAKYVISNIFKPDLKFGVGGFVHLFNGMQIQLDFCLSLLRDNWKTREAHLILSYGIPEIKF